MLDATKAPHVPPAALDTGLPRIFHAAEFDANLACILTSESYRRASLSECDLIVFPELLQARADTETRLEEISKQYQAAGRKTLVFVLNDYEGRYRYLSNLIVARTSARASKLRPNEIVLPYVWESPAKEFPRSAPSDLPQVGFCGLVSRHRKALVKKFSQSPTVRCDFVIRDKFWGGNPHDPGLVSEYYENIERNQYILCNRGAGNFSMRFYQTLACGRIPVLVDTDMPLPFPDQIPWRELIVFGKSETDCLAGVLEVHRSGACLNRQALCRATFDRFFSLQNFFPRLFEELKNRTGQIASL